MDKELISLEEKIDRLITLYRDTHAENIKLRRQLADVISANNQLTEKIQVAASRLQILLTTLPES
ncbi:hypothetical protein [Nitrosomonas sp.]|uniref:hypothetical protein n=1 Tax=Nitrosomonas sp. TaxID=42353 RepID=UPI002621B491|nr:hypothetical protein [Nitrosomonas sp.]MCW5599640.1 hypothetical protein [Nitrosomonas sp.]MCW5600069.1 hypothetical protein [Nitrosomonas sp.]